MNSVILLLFAFFLVACPATNSVPSPKGDPPAVGKNGEDSDDDDDDSGRRSSSRNRSRSSYSSSGSSSSSSTGNGGTGVTCSGGGRASTSTINGDCPYPAEDRDTLTNSRRLARVNIQYNRYASSVPKDETALSSAPSRGFRTAGVGDSDPKQDIILAMWVFGSDLFIYMLKEKIASVTNHYNAGMLMYLDGRLEFFALKFLGESNNTYNGKTVLIFTQHIGNSRRYNSILGQSDVDIHLAYQRGRTCTFWTASDTKSLSERCPRRDPDNEDKLTEMSWTEYGRYLNSDFELSMSGKTRNSSDPEQDIFLHYYRAGNKQIAVLNKSAISYSSSETYYLYVKLKSQGVIKRYELSSLDGEYCADNGIQHISFEVEDGREINEEADIWLAKEKDDTCVFYTTN